MPEMREDTFNHAEKTAADHGLLLKKADLCIKTASLMLGKSASDAMVEDQSVALMHLPDSELVRTFKRLANGQQQVAQMGQTAQQKMQAMKQQAQQCLAAGDVQAAEGCMATMMQQAQECMAQGDLQAAQECLAEAQQVKSAIEAAQQQAPVAGGMWAGKLAQDQQDDEEEQSQEQSQQQKAQQGQKQAQQIQAEQVQAAVQQAVAQAVQQVMAQMGQQAQQQKQLAQMGQQAQMHQQAQMGQQADDAALADLLMEPGLDADMSEMGIEMEPSPMDVGDAGLAPEDDVLMTLFASDEQGQGQQAKSEEKEEKEQGQGQQKQAMSRTASTRTVGTRPTQGVSRVGGSMGNSGGDVNKLAALWPSAPDVSDAFR